MGFELFKLPGVKLFLKRLTIFLVILIAADFITGSLLRHFYFKQESGLESGTIYAINKANEDLIILGSSRATHHYIPEVLSRELNMSAFNAGREGNFILYHNAVFQSMLERHKPKVVILDILNREFDSSGDSYDRLSNLMPFYRTNKAIRPTINLRGPFEPIKNLSFIYPYNSKLQAIAVGNMAFNKDRKQDFNGFIPLKRVIDRKPETVDADTSYTVDSLKIAAFKAIIDTCKNNNIRLFIVCSPYYDSLNGVDLSVRIARDIALQNGVPFWNFNTEAAFVGKAGLFDDKAHLNGTGAKAYSEFIAGKIAESQGERTGE